MTKSGMTAGEASSYRVTELQLLSATRERDELAVELRAARGAVERQRAEIRVLRERVIRAAGGSVTICGKCAAECAANESAVAAPADVG